MKTPSFWYKDSSPLAYFYAPIASLYETLSGFNEAFAVPETAPVPVICLGNLVAGGSGKTPTAISLLGEIEKSGLFVSPMFVTRGYGGRVSGPERVDVAQNGAAVMWGDEALLLARHAPTVVAAERYKGAVYAHDTGADVVILDDGLQHYGLKKDVSFCVVDGMMGFGNGRVIPAGPLRQSFENGFRKVDAVIMIGDDVKNARAHISHDIPVFTAKVDADISALAGSYVAFCGIGYPEKFKKTIEDNFISMVGFHAFADHHTYSAHDLEKLADAARASHARLLTTEKDYVRLPEGPVKDMTDILPIKIVFDDPAPDFPTCRQQSCLPR